MDITDIRPSVSLGREVREALVAAGRTQRELADHLGIAQPQVSKRLSGRVALNIDELMRIAEFLNLSLYDLLTWTER